MPILSPAKSPAIIYSAIALLSIAIFAMDLATPKGTAVWVFYFIPVVLCILQSRPTVPYVVGACIVALLIVGFLISASGSIAQDVAASNRLFSAVTVLGTAYLTSRVIAERHSAQHLLWLQQGRAEISGSMLGEPSLREVADSMLHALAKFLGAQVGSLYRLERGMLVPTGSFALDPLPPEGASIPVGQGLAGEVARTGEVTLLHDLPEGYLRLSSTVVQGKPSHLIIAPIFADRQVVGVVELGFIRRSGDFKDEVALMKLVIDQIGSAIRSAAYRQHLKDLLEETQRQSEALQAQQEELRVVNEELQEQSRALHESQVSMETQQTALEEANVQLEERTELLERQKSELVRVQRQLEANASELEKTNRYKSQFLANMSHELRTPLNSSLILSQLLVENKAGTLNEDQVRYARTIHSANVDLLTLINDILDLSRIESGQVEISPDPVALVSIFDSLHETFDPIADQKKVGFSVAISEGTPPIITTDEHRLQQVLKNLLSNAFKFTEKGEVAVEVMARPEGGISFAIRDTGIGIAPEQQEIIFEEFRQADGSTSRTYGGTGLGLSISRQLAHLLGGEIRVQSSPGMGSTFTLELPLELDVAAPRGDDVAPARASTKEHAQVTKLAEQVRQKASKVEEAYPSLKDDRAKRSHDRAILIVEDDAKFASVLCELVHEMQFDCLHAATASAAISLALEHQPNAILLDVGLPDRSGLGLLEQIKRESATRHIPVHMISVIDYMQTALELGAFGYALKPVAREEIMNAIRKIEQHLAREVDQVLIVEDNPALRDSLEQMLGSEKTAITTAATAAEALRHLSETTFDCMVLDLMLPDESGYDMLEKMARTGRYSFPPVIVYTGRVLSHDDEQRLRRYSQSIVVKGAKSPERLLDEVSLFLHRVESTLPPDQQQMLLRTRQRDAVFEGRTLLLAEDDVRNIFALTSVFEPLGATLEIARNGREALDRCTGKQGIDLVLMDLMMPEMDGLTAMREIRKLPQHRNLPIIALTAKAMSNDREDCLNAGANDYIAKPIDVDQLISLCRVWLPK
jgi:signal transduction histidine kinase/DNA-binding response OmpR family regulator